MDRKRIQEIRIEKDLDSKLLKYKGAIGVDVDYKLLKGQKMDSLSITVYVNKKLTKEELSANEVVPAEIEGIPTDVVECLNVWPSPEASAQVASAMQTETEARTGVLSGGLSISNQSDLGSYGTLGIVVISGGRNTALSSAHVMVYPPPSVGQGVIEPSGPDGGTWPTDSIGTVSLYSIGGPKNVDAALVPIDHRLSNVGQILNIGTITGHGTAVVGQTVRKMGAKTGLTQGKVASTTLTWTGNYPGLGSFTYTNQIKVENIGMVDFALGGDSGSAVIDSGSLVMLGTVMGGTPGLFTVCNQMRDLVSVIPPTMSFSKVEDK